MTDAFLHTGPQLKLDAVLAVPSDASISATSRAFRIGMPNLALAGLSENWPLKECGHRHWTLLATKLGLATRPLSEFDRADAQCCAEHRQDAAKINIRQNRHASTR